jgi:hypothetical protein
METPPLLSTGVDVVEIGAMRRLVGVTPGDAVRVDPVDPSVLPVNPAMIAANVGSSDGVSEADDVAEMSDDGSVVDVEGTEIDGKAERYDDC